MVLRDALEARLYILLNIIFIRQYIPLIPVPSFCLLPSLVVYGKIFNHKGHEGFTKEMLRSNKSSCLHLI